MNQDRDMYYSGYNYGYGQFPGMMPNNGENNYMGTLNQDLINRVNRLERQVQRLEQRITRLETPYQNNNFNNKEPDNNMYMM